MKENKQDITPKENIRRNIHMQTYNHGKHIIWNHNIETLLAKNNSQTKHFETKLLPEYHCVHLNDFWSPLPSAWALLDLRPLCTDDSDTSLKVTSQIFPFVITQAKLTCTVNPRSLWWSTYLQK